MKRYLIGFLFAFIFLSSLSGCEQHCRKACQRIIFFGFIDDEACNFELKVSENCQRAKIIENNTVIAKFRIKKGKFYVYNFEQKEWKQHKIEHESRDTTFTGFKITDGGIEIINTKNQSFPLTH